ncbi:hypothetical protein [Rhodovulum steppense]|nr:hypothetical protein [Rhodovulum steppense]
MDATIAGLRAAANAKNEAELARMPGIDQSTISSWRSRGRVPQCFVKMLEAGDKGPGSATPQVWGELQDRAASVALVRFTLLRQELARSHDVDRALAVFLDMRPFRPVLHRAVHELRLKMEALPVDLAAAQALIMQEDLRAPDATAR